MERIESKNMEPEQCFMSSQASASSLRLSHSSPEKSHKCASTCINKQYRGKTRRQTSLRSGESSAEEYSQDFTHTSISQLSQLSAKSEISANASMD